MWKRRTGVNVPARDHGYIISTGLADQKEGSMLVANMQFTNSTATACIETAHSSLNVMTMRLCLLQALKQRVGGWNITRPQAAKRLGVLPGRVDDLLSGTPASFSLDDLFRLAPRAGLFVNFDISVDEAMRSC